MENNNKEEKIIFSSGWKETEAFIASSRPTYDILITNNYLYLIELPSSFVYDAGRTVLSKAGAFSFWALGALAGAPMLSAKQKQLNKHRSSWLDEDENIISDDYRNITKFKIPKEKLKESLIIKSKLFGDKFLKIKFENNKIVLGNIDDEINKLKKYLIN